MILNDIIAHRYVLINYVQETNGLINKSPQDIYICCIYVCVCVWVCVCVCFKRVSIYTYTLKSSIDINVAASQ